MSKPFKNYTGMKFGRLTVLRREGHIAFCQCKCGNQSHPWIASLTRGTTQSCGCLQRERTGDAQRTHGMTGKHIYRVWSTMKERCESKKNKRYKNYGGRGIKVCKRWQSFENFFKDMGHPPSKEYSLHRVDNDLGYNPKNCRWATKLEQMRNMTKNVFITFDAKRKCVSEWCETYNIPASVVWSRRRRGWNWKDAIQTPPWHFNPSAEHHGIQK
jgi:hypothetical protein